MRPFPNRQKGTYDAIVFTHVRKNVIVEAMRIHEYQAKQVLAGFGIPVPRGEVASSPVEARAIAEKLTGPVVLKAQIHAGGRGKAGGII
jgi:biotin carboxylase